MLERIAQLQNREVLMGESLDLWRCMIFKRRSMNTIILSGYRKYYWRQKPRIAWLKGVDLNSNFFHIVTISHRRENRVLTITVKDDGVAETKSEVKDIFVRYFKARWYVNAPMVNGGSPHFKISSLTIRLDISLDLSLETRLWMRLKSYLCTRHHGLSDMFYKAYWNMCVKIFVM